MSLSTLCSIGVCILTVTAELIKSFQMKHDIREEMEEYGLKKKEKDNK